MVRTGWPARRLESKRKTTDGKRKRAMERTVSCPLVTDIWPTWGPCTLPQIQHVRDRYARDTSRSRDIVRSVYTLLRERRTYVWRLPGVCPAGEELVPTTTRAGRAKIVSNGVVFDSGRSLISILMLSGFPEAGVAAYRSRSVNGDCLLFRRGIYVQTTPSTCFIQ